MSGLGKHDQVITGYRDNGHGLMVGMGMNECMAGLTGRVTGCSQGKGGSMHYFAPDKNYWGGHGIVGGQAPLGTGLAYAVKYMGLKGSCLAYMGDGAVNQGAVYEAYHPAAPRARLLSPYDAADDLKRSNTGGPRRSNERHSKHSHSDNT